MKVCRSTKGHSDNHYITSKPFFCLVHLQTISDSDDDDLSDSELDDLMYLMSGSVENDDDDVQEVNTGEWNMVRNYNTKVEVDGVNQHLLAIARGEVLIVLERVRVQIIAGGRVRHLHTLSPAHFLEAWMDKNLLCSVKQYINENLSGGDPVSNSEILAFIWMELMLSFYRVSPSLYIDLEERSNFPSAGQGMDYARYREILRGLSVSGISRQVSTTAWMPPMQHD